MKDYRGTQMPVEWDHDTYHQDDEKIIFYCPNCHEALADFPTYMLDEEEVMIYVRPNCMRYLRFVLCLSFLPFATGR